MGMGCQRCDQQAGTGTVIVQVGGRTQVMAYGVMHEVKHRLSVGSVPVFSTDGLKHYFYALTSHFGQWEVGEGKKVEWVIG
jgi:hypothetical protein